MDFAPLRRMWDRVRTDRSESDTAAFMSLMYAGELVTKVTVLTVIAGLDDDRDRHRYRQLHRLVRADGIGEWATALDDTFSGSASQFLHPGAREFRTLLTQRTPTAAWQNEAVRLLRECGRKIGLQVPQAPGNVAGIQWFHTFAFIRNKTRGHGAIRTALLADGYADLERSLLLLTESFPLYDLPFAYVKRSLSGRYRITLVGGDASAFDNVKDKQDLVLDDGIYVSWGGLRKVELFVSDPDLADFFVPNGNFTNKQFELISFLSGERSYLDAKPYLLPTTQLPPSETEGLDTLKVIGQCHVNLPPTKPDYVPRPKLEGELRRELLNEHHTIVTLTGPGGIGKTSLTLSVINHLAASESPRFDVILWFSARDIDLTTHGPQIVRPQGLSLEDFAKEFVGLVQPAAAQQKGFKASEFLAQHLSRSDQFGPTLFVFDNFETVRNPGEVFTWLDTYCRAPNKVVITTRIRGEFRADFPVPVGGMSDSECLSLISATARNLLIEGLLTDEYTQSLIHESDGHPYVIKILLGEVAKAKRLTKVERIVANQDEILTALFERTYGMLMPSSQRVFLTLCSWRSTIPEIALEAVLLRPQNERINLKACLDELLDSSFVEEIESAEDGARFLSVPLAASLFGRRKLAASPWKVMVEADMEFLRAFGAAQKGDVRHGIEPHILKFFRTVAADVSRGGRAIPTVRPMLEVIARKYPIGWLYLADLYLESRPTDYMEQVKQCYQRYLEKPNGPLSAVDAWRKLSDICRQSGDALGELHALSEMCVLPEVSLVVLSNAANRVNSILGSPYRERVPKVERIVLARKIADKLETHARKLDAEEFSRLAWLYIHLGDEEKARSVAELGLTRDSDDLHCRRIVDRLSGMRDRWRFDDQRRERGSFDR
jgi:hypothetical protein